VGCGGVTTRDLLGLFFSALQPVNIFEFSDIKKQIILPRAGTKKYGRDEKAFSVFF
jgi:hypothetical protein